MVSLPAMKCQLIQLGGGLDLATTPLARNPGFAISAINVEPGINGGYRRTIGYDRFDGHPSPSQTKGYFVLRTDGVNPLPAWSGFIPVSWSGGSGVLLHVSGNDAIVGADIAPPLVAGGTFTIAGITYTLATSVSRNARTIGDALVAQGRAADWRRSFIGSVPGIGPVRCVVALRDSVFAIRDKSVTEAALFKASSTGWQPVADLGLLASVTAASGIDDGDIVLVRTGDGVTIHAVAQMNADGSSGVLVIESGKSVAAGNVLTASGCTCQVSSVAPITIAAGGRYDVRVHNFFGDPSMRRAYLASGVQRAFELRENGRVVPLHAVADVALDTPILVEAHADHLFLAYPGGQYQHSGPGNPLTWSGMLGAEAFAVGDEITGLKISAGGILLVTCKNRTLALYGSGATDWQQKVISESVGIHVGTLQPTFVPIGLSDRGLVRLDRVQEFGDFALNLLDTKEKIQSVINRFSWHASSQVADANQYRLYSTSGRNLAVKLNADGSIEASEFFYPSPVDQCWRYDEQVERVFFTLSGQEGMVYEQSDNAFSFDGSEINWLLRLAYTHCGSPQLLKSWRSAELEQNSSGRLTMNVAHSLEYWHGSHYSASRQKISLSGIDAGVWNYSSWNNFYWLSDADESSAIQLTGQSTSISLAFSGRSAIEPNFSLTGLLLRYLARRDKRV
ncbi:hypothetical protein [Pseudaeromonas pectinilytica]